MRPKQSHFFTYNACRCMPLQLLSSTFNCMHLHAYICEHTRTSCNVCTACHCSSSSTPAPQALFHCRDAHCMLCMHNLRMHVHALARPDLHTSCNCMLSRGPRHMQAYAVACTQNQLKCKQFMPLHVLRVTCNACRCMRRSG